MLYPLAKIEALLLALTTLTFATPTTELSALDATDAVVVGHLFPACNGKKIRKPLNVPVDRCLSTPNLALEIRTAATCANGTRAQWARFPEKGCGYGTLDPEFGLVELRDEEIGTCLDVMNIGSMAFWCEGVKKTDPEDDKEEKKPENPDKTKKGTVSESVCMVGKAPFWNHPKPDTCVDIRSEKIQVSSPAICANGTQSTFALYKGAGCHGAPSEFRTMNEEGSKDCLDVNGLGSFAFFCSGEGIERTGSGSGHGRNGNSGSPLQFLLILTLIIMMFFLMLLLSILTWVRKYGGSLGKLIEFARNLIRPKDGAIAI